MCSSDLRVVRIESVHDKTAVTFDGEFTQGIADRTDESLMDTFVSWIRPRGCFMPCERAHQWCCLGVTFGRIPSARTPRDLVTIFT